MVVDMGTHCLPGLPGAHALMQIAVPGLEERVRFSRPLCSIPLSPGLSPSAWPLMQPYAAVIEMLNNACSAVSACSATGSELADLVYDTEQLQARPQAAAGSHYQSIPCMAHHGWLRSPRIEIMSVSLHPLCRVSGCARSI